MIYCVYIHPGEVIYQIQSGNTDIKFSLDPGAGHLVLTGALDYETSPSYTLQIIATVVLEFQI